LTVPAIAALGVVVLALGAALAQASPSLLVPVECEVGTACVLQNHVDHDPGPGGRDYRCGFLTYDGHKGTDIRVVDAEAFRSGVAVTAAAPGRVRAVRDGVADVNVRTLGREAVAGREAGNSGVIDHGDGWETQYGHLRRGSIAVRGGDEVTAGQRLGMVGLSGYTEFPHLHFEVRHRGRAVDPFVGEEGAPPCRLGARPLWARPALEVLAYVATGLLGAGISGEPPRLSDVGVDRERTGRFTGASAAVVFWVQIYGAQADDEEELRLTGPAGRVLAERRRPIERTRAQWLAYLGLRRRDPAWPAGRYRGEYVLYRGSPREAVLSIAREVDLPAQ
jgi:hypothetical protein